MNNCILVLGTGGREYAIVKRLKEDSIKLNINIKILCLLTNINDKIKDYCDVIPSEDNLIEKINILIKENKIIMSIVGSEDFLNAGVGDIFNEANIPCLGPNILCSQLETSKFFCRTFINSINKISNYNPKYSIYYSKQDLINNYYHIKNKYDEFVIKKDGLHRGKGVYVQNNDFDNNLESIESLDLGSSTLIIEEKLYGEEYSLMSLVDYGNNIVHFPPIRDYKRLENNNLGCNTGGMGCVIDANNTLPFLTKEDIITSQEINEIIIKKCNNSLGNYRGILYGSFIKTAKGIKIIEYNCRFGDPESIIGLNLLKNNFYNVCMDFCNGNLKSLNFSQDASICVYVVPKTYCKQKEKNHKYDLYFNENLENDITFSNIEILDNHIYSLNSRCFAITISSNNLYNCYQKIYNKLSNINGYIHYRNDIGKNFLSNYEASGVSIKEASKSLIEIKKSILNTYNENVISEYGSFGGEYKLSSGNILVSSIDGVGTKTILSKNYKGIEGFINLGKDIVGHSINDILVQGAEPLFFLDYYGCNNLDTKELQNFITGVSIQCQKYGKIPILGGETAEMSKVYNKDCTDLIGCIIGLKNEKFFKNNIKTGDLIINLPSIGPHTNGFTLINNLIDANTPENIINTLLNPHKCYLNEIYSFVNKFGYDNLHGMCHITGGGLHDNLKRVIGNMNYNIDIDNEPLPDWCNYIKEKGNIDSKEMLNVFNCGYGFILIVSEELESSLHNLNFEYTIIGNIL